MIDPKETTLESLEVGAVPLVARFLEELDLGAILERHLPPKRLGRPEELSTAKTLEVMIANVLLSRSPLYAVPGWLDGLVVEHFGIEPWQRRLFNDDRLGRALERLFEANLASLATDAVVTAVRQFEIELRRTHNDSTSVTFHGDYPETEGRRGKEPPRITFGYNKDHRPDLKQLLFELSVTADGAVPIHFALHDGNVTDDQTHRRTWRTLRELVGGPDFVYVADSKLCVSETMRMIHDEGGTFVTVLPRSRFEDGWFKDYLDDHLVPWEEARRRPDPRDKKAPDVVHEAFESPQRSKEGFRIFWYRCSKKREDDRNRRHHKTTAARTRIEALENRAGRNRFRSLEAAQEAADKIADDMGVARFLKIRAIERSFEEYAQDGPGRPGPNTRYKRADVSFVCFEISDDHEALQEAARHDGIFPLITNSEKLTAAETLDMYKYQPFLEKRHEQLKSVLDVAPVFLKKPERVAALLFLYFLALLIYSLVEREVRRQMKRRRVASLPLYPEARLCRAPTADLVAAAFLGCRRHRLLGPDGEEIRVFHDPLSDVARKLLDLLDVDPAHYGIEK